MKWSPTEDISTRTLKETTISSKNDLYWNLHYIRQQRQGDKKVIINHVSISPYHEVAYNYELNSCCHFQISDNNVLITLLILQDNWHEYTNNVNYNRS